MDWAREQVEGVYSTDLGRFDSRRLAGKRQAVWHFVVLGWLWIQDPATRDQRRLIHAGAFADSCNWGSS
jgi:hypothetical protein